MVFAVRPELSSHKASGNLTYRLVADASKHEYLCAKDIVHRESHIFHGYSDGFTCAGPQVSPAHPDRCEEGRARWNALESTMGPDHRKGPAARNAFFAGPKGRPPILTAILRDGRNRQTRILGLLLPGTCGYGSRPESEHERPPRQAGSRETR